uniref:Uncharacterized protein n=1 Tax=Romanomermis culicivorax TaxID=13658 RepID=A0A915LEA8_ROMCU
MLCVKSIDIRDFTRVLRTSVRNGGPSSHLRSNASNIDFRSHFVAIGGGRLASVVFSGNGDGHGRNGGLLPPKRSFEQRSTMPGPVPTLSLLDAVDWCESSLFLRIFKSQMFSASLSNRFFSGRVSTFSKSGVTVLLRRNFSAIVDAKDALSSGEQVPSKFKAKG